MGPLILIGNFLYCRYCCITENMVASIGGVHCTISFGNIAELEAGIWAKVLAGCSLGQGEAAVGMTSMVAMVAVWPSVCSPVSGPGSGLELVPTWGLSCLLSLVWSLPPSALSSPCQGREARLQITLVQTSIPFI